MPARSESVKRKHRLTHSVAYEDERDGEICMRAAAVLISAQGETLLFPPKEK